MKVYAVIYRHLIHGIYSLDSIFDSYEKAVNHVKSGGYVKEMVGYDGRMSSFVADNDLDVADIFEVPVL